MPPRYPEKHDFKCSCCVVSSDVNIMFICVPFQHLEELWRDARWMVVLQSARYKHQNSGVSLGCIIDFSKESIPEKPASTSSQVDYLPSPTPSPESTRKHNGERERWAVQVTESPDRAAGVTSSDRLIQWSYKISLTFMDNVLNVLLFMGLELHTSDSQAFIFSQISVLPCRNVVIIYG